MRIPGPKDLDPIDEVDVDMKRLAMLAMVGGLGLISVGCARPFEVGYTPAYTTSERVNMIARNWDMEGKQMQDDIDSALLLRPMGRMSIWNVR